MLFGFLTAFCTCCIRRVQSHVWQCGPCKTKKGGKTRDEKKSRPKSKFANKCKRLFPNAMWFSCALVFWRANLCLKSADFAWQDVFTFLLCRARPLKHSATRMPRPKYSERQRSRSVFTVMMAVPCPCSNSTCSNNNSSNERNCSCTRPSLHSDNPASHHPPLSWMPVRIQILGRAA